MIATLATPMVFPKIAPSMPVVDLFNLEEPSQTSFQKRPCPDDDYPNVVRLYIGLIEE